MMLQKESLDALLRDWPAPGVNQYDLAPDDEAASPRADDILHAVLSRPHRDADGLAELLAAPPLAAEPGEPSIFVSTEVGEDKKVSRDNESSRPPSRESMGASSVPPAERKRTSLRAIAERANQASSARTPSSSGTSSSAPPPASTFTPLPGRTSTSPLAHRTEATRDDSGVVNLNPMNASAGPAPIAATEDEKPHRADLFAQAKPAAALMIAEAPITVLGSSAPKKRNAGVVAGIAIAMIGLAAAFALIQRKPVAATIQAAAESRSAPVAEVTPTLTPTQATATPVQAVAAAEPRPTAEPTAPQAPKPAAPGPISATNLSTAPKDPRPEDSKVAATSPKSEPLASQTSDLRSEMIRAAGGTKEPGAPVAAVPEPAAGNPKSQNIPEKPSQGSVQAAVGAVMGGAKACVTGGDDVSRATVTFGSSGVVTGVGVTGWAATHGKSGCVQAALMGAKVGPFSSPSYSFGVSIRP